MKHALNNYLETIIPELTGVYGRRGYSSNGKIKVKVSEYTEEIKVFALVDPLPELNKDDNLFNLQDAESDFSNEREILYKVLFDMKSDLNDLKKLTLELMKNGTSSNVQENNKSLIQKIYGQNDEISEIEKNHSRIYENQPTQTFVEEMEDEEEDFEPYLIAETVDLEDENLRLDEKEVQLIKKALERNKGKRKAAADELGISERTLYRKIKQYDL